MLNSIRIQGFKAVFDATLELGPFTLLIGRNGTGKSSALEALQWLRDSTFLGLAAATGGYVDFHQVINRRAEITKFDLHFEKEGRTLPVHYVLGVAATTPRKGMTRRPTVETERCVVGRTSAAKTVLHSRKGERGNWRWIAGRGGPLPIRSGDQLGLGLAALRGAGGAASLVGFLERSVFLRLSPQAIAAPVRDEPKAWRPILSDDGSDLALLLAQMPATSHARIADRLQKIFPGVQGLRVTRIGEERRFAVREKMRSRGGTAVYDIPSWLLSEGMRRLVAILALLELDPLPALIAVEEVENGLDPWTLREVLQTLREISSEVQVVVTTHSPFLLDHVTTEEVVHVRRVNGDTTFTRVSRMAEAARYDRVLAPGAMYLSSLFDDEDQSKADTDDD